MGTWSKNKVNPSSLNSGNEYASGDNLSVESLNAIVNSGLYSQDFAEHLADTPDTSEAGNIGTPSVELIDNVVDNKTYKKFKFKNLRIQTTDAPVVQTSGQSTTDVMSQKAVTDLVASSNEKELLYNGNETFTTSDYILTLSKPIYVGDILEIVYNEKNVDTIRYVESGSNFVSHSTCMIITTSSSNVVNLAFECFNFTMPNHSQPTELKISQTSYDTLQHSVAASATPITPQSPIPFLSNTKIHAIYRLGRVNTGLYDISTTLTNVSDTYNNNPTVIAANGTAVFMFTASSGYSLPSTISVTGATASWVQSTGILTLSNPTGNVSITVIGVVGG